MEINVLNDLVEAAKRGDKHAFGELVQANAALVTGVAFSVLGDFAQSEDVGQEAFFEAWRDLGKLRAPDKFKAWICTIARRRAIDALRVRRIPQSSPSELSAVDPAKSPEEVMSDEQNRQLVWSILESLPDNYRETMVLYYRAEQSVEQVAIALDLNEASVRQRLKRGRDLLRNEVLEKLSGTLRTTAPTAAFAAAVVAGLPTLSIAAGAGTAVAASGAKAAAAPGTASAIAVVSSGAIFGPLIGLTGGFFGAYMSWRNAEYKSQQQFVVRQAIVYSIGIVAFGLLLTLMLVAAAQQWLEGRSYTICLIVLLLGFQVWSIAWIWRGIRDYKKLTQCAQRDGHPRLPRAQQMHEQLEKQTRVVRADGSIGYEAFRWNAPAWFGSLFGGTGWMLFLSLILLANGGGLPSGIALACFLASWIVGVRLWQRRSRMRSLLALQLLLMCLAINTSLLFAAVQFLASPEQQVAVQWNPWGWAILLIFPVLILQFKYMQRQLEAKMHAEAGRSGG